MRVLVACEYSGRVRDAFIRHGHEAMSCDILPSDSPGPHYQGDVQNILGDNWELDDSPPTLHIHDQQWRDVVAQRPYSVGEIG